MILAFSIRKDPRVNGKVTNHVQDYQTCGSGTDGWKRKINEYTNGHRGFEMPKMPVGYSSKFNS